MMEITEIEKEAVKDEIEQGRRMDGRDFKEWRDVKVTTGAAKKAEGSARVEFGDTKVIVGVKMGVGEPFPDTPDEGILMVNAELGPIASPKFESGPPGEDATELARVVDRGIRESKALPLADLCIEEGEKVWKVMVDIHVLDHNGNLMDASGLGAIKALMDAKAPGYEDGKVQREEENELPVRKVPVPCSVVKINNEYLIDPDLKEEKIADSILTATWIEDGLCSLQKRGVGGFSTGELEKIFKISRKKSSELREIIEG